jgi:hypothetical protein
MHGTPQNTHVRAGIMRPRRTWRPRRTSCRSKPSRSSFRRVGDSFTWGRTSDPGFCNRADVLCGSDFPKPSSPRAFQSRGRSGRVLLSQCGPNFGTGGYCQTSRRLLRPRRSDAHCAQGVSGRGPRWVRWDCHERQFAYAGSLQGDGARGA